MQHYFDKTAIALLSVAAFLLTLWRFGANQCLALVVIMVIVHRPWREALFSSRWLKTPVVLISLIFLGLAVLSVAYSQTPTVVKALQGITAYSKLLFLLVFPLVLQKNQYRKWLEQGLIYGVLVNVIISTLYYYHVPFVVKHLGPYFSMDISFSVNPLQLIYVVVMAIWLLTMRFFKREHHWQDALIFLVLLFYLWFINMERSGYLLFLALLLLLLLQQFGWKALLAGCIILPVLFWGFYIISPNVKARVDLGVHNVVAYHEAASSTAIGVDNSLGLRLAFAKESFDVIKDHPWFGTGIGSFRYVYAKLYASQAQTVKVNDPHNAYIYVAFELGLVGLLIYLAWLRAIWKLTGSLPIKERHLLQGVWLMFVVMGFTDSGLALNAIGISFILWTSLYSYVR